MLVVKREEGGWKRKNRRIRMSVIGIISSRQLRPGAPTATADGTGLPLEEAPGAPPNHYLGRSFPSVALSWSGMAPGPAAYA